MRKLALDRIYSLVRFRVYRYLYIIKETEGDKVTKRLAKFLLVRLFRLRNKLCKNGFKLLKENLKIQKKIKKLNNIEIILSSKFRLMKKSGILSLKYFFDTKKSNALLWRIKFYQLEGLIQHKQEENSMRLKH